MAKRTKALAWVQVECRCCGAVFETQGKNTKYCADCRDLETIDGTKVKRDANKALLAYVEKIDRYNEKHGTHLSYGQYTLAKYLGGAT